MISQNNFHFLITLLLSLFKQAFLNNNQSQNTQELQLVPVKGTQAVAIVPPFRVCPLLKGFFSREFLYDYFNGSLSIQIEKVLYPRATRFPLRPLLARIAIELPSFNDSFIPRVITPAIEKITDTPHETPSSLTPSDSLSSFSPVSQSHCRFLSKSLSIQHTTSSHVRVSNFLSSSLPLVFPPLSPCLLSSPSPVPVLPSRSPSPQETITHLNLEGLPYPMNQSVWAEFVGYNVLFGDTYYEVKSLISGTTRSAVFNVIDIATRVQYILKISSKNEFQQLRALHGYKGIVKVVDWNECAVSEFWAAFVMRKAENTLTNWLGEHLGKSRDDKERFIKEVLEIVGYIHSKKLMVGDISPNNFVLIKRKGSNKFHVCMIDFEGVHAVNHRGVIVIPSCQAIFTPGFSAPEFPTCADSNGQVVLTQRQDIFAAAAVCFYIIFGTIPTLKDELKKSGPWNSFFERKLRKTLAVNELIGVELIKLFKFYPSQRGNLSEVLKNLEWIKTH